MPYPNQPYGNPFPSSISSRSSIPRSIALLGLNPRLSQLCTLSCLGLAQVYIEALHGHETPLGEMPLLPVCSMSCARYLLALEATAALVEGPKLGALERFRLYTEFAAVDAPGDAETCSISSLNFN